VAGAAVGAMAVAVVPALVVAAAATVGVGMQIYKEWVYMQPQWG